MGACKPHKECPPLPKYNLSMLPSLFTHMWSPGPHSTRGCCIHSCPPIALLHFLCTAVPGAHTSAGASIYCARDPPRPPPGASRRAFTPRLSFSVDCDSAMEEHSLPSTQPAVCWAGACVCEEDGEWEGPGQGLGLGHGEGGSAEGPFEGETHHSFTGAPGSILPVTVPACPAATACPTATAYLAACPAATARPIATAHPAAAAHPTAAATACPASTAASQPLVSAQPCPAAGNQVLGQVQLGQAPAPMSAPLSSTMYHMHTSSAGPDTPPQHQRRVAAGTSPAYAQQEGVEGCTPSHPQTATAPAFVYGPPGPPAVVPGPPALDDWDWDWDTMPLTQRGPPGII